MRTTKQSVLIKPKARRGASLALALLLALPAAAQTAPPADGGTRNVTTDDNGDPTSAVPPALELPALGPLSGRDNPLVIRPAEGGMLPGFGASAPGLGTPGISAADLGDRPYAIRPSIGVGVLATDNLFQTNYDRRGDIVTTIAPGIEAAISTARLNGALRYSPALRLYASNSNQNGLDQYGDGKLLAVLIPGTLFLDMRGSASVLPATAGLIPGSGQAIAGNNTLQTYLTQVTPFLSQRFGSAASSQLGYSFEYARQGWASFSNTGPDSSTANFTAHRGFAVVRSGEDLGRLALQARVDGIWYAGSGIYSGANNFLAGLGARYAIFRSVAVIGEIGYENQHYAGTNPINIEDAVWSIGLRLTPSPDSFAIVRYGHKDGVNSLSLNAGLALGMRTSLFATYSDTLATSLTQGQNLLAATTTDAFGNTVDSQSGAPVVLINSFLGLTNTLYRMRVGTVSLNHRWPRDTITLSGTWQAQDPVTSAYNTPFVSSSNGIYATLGWAHEFSRNTSGAVTAQYGYSNFWQNGSGTANFWQNGFANGGNWQTGWGGSDTLALSATLAHQLNEKLAASVQVAWTGSTSQVPGQGYTQGVIRAGLRRTF